MVFVVFFQFDSVKKIICTLRLLIMRNRKYLHPTFVHTGNYNFYRVLTIESSLLPIIEATIFRKRIIKFIRLNIRL